MNLIDGTPEAMKLINELKASGDLIDIVDSNTKCNTV